MRSAVTAAHAGCLGLGGIPHAQPRKPWSGCSDPTSFSRARWPTTRAFSWRASSTRTRWRRAGTACAPNAATSGRCGGRGAQPSAVCALLTLGGAAVAMAGRPIRGVLGREADQLGGGGACGRGRPGHGPGRGTARSLRWQAAPARRHLLHAAQLLPAQLPGPPRRHAPRRIACCGHCRCRGCDQRSREPNRRRGRILGRWLGIRPDRDGIVTLLYSKNTPPPW